RPNRAPLSFKPAGRAGRHNRGTCSMSKAFASQADLQAKRVTFTRLSANAYAYTAEGDPNTGVIVGDNAVMVIDTQATPAMAEDPLQRRPGRVRRHALCRRRLLPGLAADARQHRRAAAGGARARTRRRAHLARHGAAGTRRHARLR